MDDLEDSLNRLFRDSRLDVQVAPGADSAVVSGARRVRRRRIAMISAAGVMSLAVLGGGTFLLARPAPQQNEMANQPTDLPLVTTQSTPVSQAPTNETTAPNPATSTTTTTNQTPPSSTRPGQQPGAPTVMPSSFGPTSYGAFRLGMTDAQLPTNGVTEAQPADDSASCARYRVSGAPEVSTVTVSKRYGLVAITVTANAQTPQGIGIGATEAQVQSAYRATITTTVPGNTNANYEFRYTDGKLSEMTLATKIQDCG